MKPIRLVLSAFGSYAQEVTIDFTKVRQGVFLVTGDTGSGKTTIFDAIVYALYDRTSGGSREPYEMRSQYASPEIATFVEYTFSYGDNIYTVKRNPRYTRVSKRKDKDGNLKETVEQPSVELTLPDGTLFVGKIKETNEKLVEIMGLDAEQFSQIAMIAQGEFMRLLQAPSNKRKEIFSRIFQTKIYWQIQEALHKKAKEIYIALEDNRKFCQQELASIKVVMQENVEEEQEFVFTETQQESLQERLQQLIEKGKEQEKECKTKLNKIQKDLEQMSAKLAAGEEINKQFELLEKSKAKQVVLEEQKTAMEELTQTLQKAKKAEQVAVEEERLLTCVKAWEEGVQRLAEYGELYEQKAKELDDLTKQQQEMEQLLQQQAPQIQEQLTRIKDAMPQYEKVRICKEQQLVQEKKVAQFCAMLDKDVQKLAKEKEALIQIHQHLNDMLQQYQEMNDAFIAEQAGIMASTLLEGQPCPVCGSTTHPQKAQMSDVAVTQEQVNQCKERWLQTDTQEKKQNQLLQQLQGEIAELQKNVQEEQTALEALKVQYDAWKQQLVFEDEEQAKKEQCRLETKLQQLQNQLQTAQTAQLQCKDSLTEVSGKRQEQDAQLQRLGKERKALEKTYEKAWSKIFETQEQYQLAKATHRQVEVWEKEVAAYHDNCVRNEEAIKQLEKQVKGKEKADLSQMREELRKQQEDRKALERSYKEWYSTNQRNQEVQQQLEKLLVQRDILKQQYDVYNGLDKTANGNLAGSAKIDFQTFIQRRFFERMIHEANKRLVKMTSNQFILQCRSLDKLGTQGAVGLDLDVYSVVTDKTRDVKTLSGGESFMAALSMALGMADVIQHTAGKVKLDTMFVDEGFGSLDEESRAQAMQILQELAADTRLVGIISHVTELKEQIDCKLVVQKDEKGSTVYWSE